MSELISVTPVEYSRKRIVRYYGYKLDDFDAEELQEAFGELNLRETPAIWQDGDKIFYQYPRQPLIVIKDRQFFVTEETWQSKDLPIERIRHQASILLRILHGLEMASYNRKAVQRYKFIPYKFRRKRY